MSKTILISRHDPFMQFEAVQVASTKRGSKLVRVKSLNNTKNYGKTFWMTVGALHNNFVMRKA